MYNPKNARSDDYSRVNLRHEIIAPNVPDLNLLNVFDSNIHNKNQIFPHQDVNSNMFIIKKKNNNDDVNNTILQTDHDKRDESARLSRLRQASNWHGIHRRSSLSCQP